MEPAGYGALEQAQFASLAILWSRFTKRIPVGFGCGFRGRRACASHAGGSEKSQTCAARRAFSGLLFSENVHGCHASHACCVLIFAQAVQLERACLIRSLSLAVAAQ